MRSIASVYRQMVLPWGESHSGPTCPELVVRCGVGRRHFHSAALQPHQQRGDSEAVKTGELAWAAAVVFWPAARRYEHTAACGGGGVPRRLSVLGPASVPARKREGGAGSALVRC